MRKAALVLISLVAAGSFAASALAEKPSGAQCWTSSSQIAVGDSYQLWASGLPMNGQQLNLVVMFPNGNRLTSPFSSSDGSFSAQSSDSTIQAADPGTYTFKFVGKVSWPSGSWNKEYATCSMQVG